MGRAVLWQQDLSFPQPKPACQQREHSTWPHQNRSSLKQPKQTQTISRMIMVFSRINRTVRRQKPFAGNEIQLQAGWGPGSMAGSDHVPYSHTGQCCWPDPVPFFTLLGRSTSISSSECNSLGWSFLSHGTAREGRASNGQSTAPKLPWCHACTCSGHVWFWGRNRGIWGLSASRAVPAASRLSSAWEGGS